MGLSGALIFNSAVDQIQASAKNLQALQDARKKRKQEDEMFDINKKKAELDLKASELKGESTSIQNKIQKSLMDEYFSQQKMINDGKNAQIDQVEHQQTTQLDRAKNVAGTILKTDPLVQSMVAQRINPRLATVPGPNGGMIQGQDMSGQIDDTPEAVPSAFSGVPENPLQPSLGANGFTLKSQKQKDFIASKIEKQKKAGIPLLPEEQYFDYRHTLEKQGIKYNRGAVLNQAKNLVKLEAGKDAIITPKMIADMIPEAEKALYGISFKDHVGEPDSQVPVPPEDNPEPVAKAENKDLGKIDNERVKVKDKSGKMFTLPKSQLEEAKKQGYSLVN